jgi:hypothetical protein
MVNKPIIMTALKASSYRLRLPLILLLTVSVPFSGLKLTLSKILLPCCNNRCDKPSLIWSDRFLNGCHIEIIGWLCINNKSLCEQIMYNYSQSVVLVEFQLANNYDLNVVIPTQSLVLVDVCTYKWICTKSSIHNNWAVLVDQSCTQTHT